MYAKFLKSPSCVNPDFSKTLFDASFPDPTKASILSTFSISNRYFISALVISVV